MTNFTPQEITRFSNWINEKEEVISKKVGFLVGNDTIKYIFSVIRSELFVEFDVADKNYSKSFEEKT
jgi:hypothetical protein